MESISFGDGSYRAMVDARMSTNNPLVIPFYNWSGFEGNTTTQNVNQQFAIGTESLNGIIGTLRPQNYDSQVTSVMGGFDSDLNGNRYVPQLGNDPTTGDKAATTGSGRLYSATTAPGAGAITPYPTNSFVGWYHTFLSGEQPTSNGGSFGGQGTWTSNYQFNIDSKLYPQVSSYQVHPVFKHVVWIVQYSKLSSQIEACHVISYLCLFFSAKTADVYSSPVHLDSSCPRGLASSFAGAVRHSNGS